jgi:single-strand DNA-binding protein
MKIEQGGPGWVAGNMTVDPVIRYVGKGKLMVRLRVAVSDRVRDPDSGQWREGPVRYVDVTCFGRLAENVGDHLVRGNRIVAAGVWQRETWTDTKGDPHQRVSLLARDLGPSVAFDAARYIKTMTQEAE